MSGSGTAPPNPAGWPDEVLAIVRGAITCEFATLTSDGRPVTWPVTPYLGEDGRTIDISTGLAYPMKAERARRMPVCSILFSDPVGSGLPDPPAVLVHGFASVRDRDLQANTDRYVRLSMGKVPDAWRGVPPFVIRMQRWYWARIWVQVTPIRIAWWPRGNMSGPSRTWDAPAGTRAPDSDPPPEGRRPRSWRAAPPDWRGRADGAMALGSPVLTVRDASGFPVPFRAGALERLPEGFRLHLPPGCPAEGEGPACLTFHRHPERFVGQENAVFVGIAEVERAAPFGAARTMRFRVERALADFSLPVGRARQSAAFLRAGLVLSRRARLEAARRGQRVPRVRLPRPAA